MHDVELPLEEPLRGCVFACETHCVAGCCGLSAFDFGAENVRAWAVDRTPGELDEARRQLARCIELALDARARIGSNDLNFGTGANDAARLELLAALRALEASLALVQVPGVAH